MEMNAENVNFLITRIRNLMEFNNRLTKQVEAGHEDFDLRRKDIEHLKSQLEHKVERVKELERILELKDNQLKLIEDQIEEEDIEVPDGFKLIDGKEYWFEYCDDPEQDDYANNGHWKGYDCPNSGRIYERISEKEYTIAYFAALKTNKLKA